MAALANVQAIVAHRSDKPLVAILLFKLGEAAGAKAFLRRWADKVRNGSQTETAGDPALYFFFAWSALAKLLQGGALDPADGRGALEPFFVDPGQGPASLALRSQLGFVGSSAPESWWDGVFSNSDIELALYCGFDDAPQRDLTLGAIRASAAECGLRELRVTSLPDAALCGGHSPDGRVHFGYRDGVTTPDVDWDDSAAPGKADLREFLLGYPNDDYPVSPVSPGPWQDFVRDGSFVVLTWLYQDVAAFNRCLRDSAQAAAPYADGADPQEWVAAKIMGRWRDGTALSKYPSQPPAQTDLDNAFGYADDPLGRKAPLSSHIRVSNLRDQALNFRNQSRFPKGPPRVIRRGFSYGARLEGTEDDGANRGLVGLFFCARINEQVYTLLRWMQKSDFSDAFRSIPRGSDCQDGVAGCRSGQSVNATLYIPHESRPPLNLTLPRFIQFRGVAPFFVPSLATLATLAAA